jgi:hypothetical protein
MNKETMIRNYRKFSKADKYILGFVYKHELYMIMVDEIAPRFMKVERESTKKGGHQKLQLRLNNKYMLELIRKGARKIGSENLVLGGYNKGVEFERLVHDLYNVVWGGKDNRPFYECGDMHLENMEVQIKLNGAQIVVETTLENLKKKRVDK